MVNFHNLLAKFSADDARSIAYYLTRYFKGAPSLELGGKDIFKDIVVDFFDDEADQRIRDATLEAIAKIEQEVGVPASELDEDTVYRILGAIADFEDAITEEPSAKHVAEAISFLGKTKSIG
ncbi:hypothetical protein [Novosphingobium sp. AAP1]|uniref:hypothetical protein n=1 Tax=Novosphingobium sp. AAP1 TaxID=1523413 RepID=UPI0012E18372|nr:hypothetical protein [Novosphingobium sp. AAP1]